MNAEVSVLLVEYHLVRAILPNVILQSVIIPNVIAQYVVFKITFI
jgi:hypothetical protein